jgi:hypothetical protein
MRTLRLVPLLKKQKRNKTVAYTLDMVYNVGIRQRLHSPRDRFRAIVLLSWLKIYTTRYRDTDSCFLDDVNAGSKYTVTPAPLESQWSTQGAYRSLVSRPIVKVPCEGCRVDASTSRIGNDEVTARFEPRTKRLLLALMSSRVCRELDGSCEESLSIGSHPRRSGNVLHSCPHLYKHQEQQWGLWS